MKQLSGLDAGFVHLERNNNKFQVGTLLFYDVSTAKNGFVRFKDILKTFESRITPDSMMRKKIQKVPLDLDHPYWINDPDFDIEYHVHHIALPKPGDWRQLCILVARIHARQLDFSKPLWEAYVIEGLDNVEGIPKGGFAIYVKLHHAAVDGVGGNDLITAIHDLVPVPKKSVDKEVINTTNDRVSNITMFTRAYFSVFRQPKKILHLAQTLVPALDRIRKGQRDHTFTPLGAAQYTRFNDNISGNMVLGAAIFDFNGLRNIKNSIDGVTINDVMLALVSGALQKYLTSKNEKPGKNLVAAMPVNIRPYLEGMTNDDSSNLVSISKVSLNNKIEDPLDRLVAIHQSTQESKAYQNAMGAKVMLEVSRAMPALLTSLAARALPAIMLSDEPMVNTVVTNVPGSQVPLYMGGARLAGMSNIGLLVEGMGLFHAVSSYCGTATISFQSCRRMMPDPEFYRECIEASFRDLTEAVDKQKKKTATKLRSKTRAKTKANKKVTK